MGRAGGDKRVPRRQRGVVCDGFPLAGAPLFVLLPTRVLPSVGLEPSCVAMGVSRGTCVAWGHLGRCHQLGLSFFQVEMGMRRKK